MSDIAVYVSTNLIEATRSVFRLTVSDYYPRRNYILMSSGTPWE